jgi:nucleotide-binding universal stress UspA family protein
MMTIDRILCPANLPLESDEAVSYAASLARTYEAKLFLCHCAAAPALVTFLHGGAASGPVRNALVDSLSRYIGPADCSQPRWEVIVVEGGKEVGAEIVHMAQEHHVDLIVMRSKRSPVATLLGSSAEQVSRTASCAVLVIHSPQYAREKAGANSLAEFRRVLVSHDFSGSSELSLSYGLSIAQKYRAELHLMHVLPEPGEDQPEIALSQAGVESAYQRAARRLEASVPAEVYRLCKVMHIVRWGKPYREVLAYASKQKIDLVCMGALGRDFGLQALFGSYVDGVLRQAPCPVLVARPLKPVTRTSLISAPKAHPRKISSSGFLMFL